MSILGTNTNIFSNIICQHGRDVIKVLSGAQRSTTVKKLARWQNHRTFNIRCAKSNVIPTSLKLITIITGTKASVILHSAERKLLNVRIHQCTFTINKLKDVLSNHKQTLASILDPATFTEVETFLAHAHEHTSAETKTRQKQKFDKLVTKQQTAKAEKQSTTNKINTDRWVINTSDRPLTDSEHSVLKKGLNYAITPTKLPIPEIIAQAEMSARHLPPTDAEALRGDVVKTLKQAKLPKPNITQQERAALTSLKGVIQAPFF